MALLEVLGKVLEYVGFILVDFLGCFPLFYAIPHNFTLIFDSMISYSKFRGAQRSNLEAFDKRPLKGPRKGFDRP